MVKERTTSRKSITACLSCDKHLVLMPQDKICKKCSGIIHTFDSNMEYLRYIYLKNAPYISKLSIQKSFEIALPKAIYSQGYITEREPQLIGYEKNAVALSAYKIDFVYYDKTTPMGWVAEEFKPCFEKMDSETKKKLLQAYDQHSEWGHFCFSYPEKSFDIVNGKNQLRAYKRHFVKRYKNTNEVRYPLYNEMFQ
jgi:hypothetical protein